jgi:hypothetical protein
MKWNNSNCSGIDANANWREAADEEEEEPAKEDAKACDRPFSSRRGRLEVKSVETVFLPFLRNSSEFIACHMLP